MAVQQNLGEGCTVLHMLGRKELMYKLKYSLVYFPVVGYGPCPGIASQAFVSTLLAHFGIPNTDGPNQKHWILPRASPRWLFVNITDEEGNYGWGEFILEGHTQAVEGCLEFHKSQFTTGMDAEGDHVVQWSWNAAADAVFMSALSGVDSALWGLKGKSRQPGLPDVSHVGGYLGDAPHRGHVRGLRRLGSDQPPRSALHTQLLRPGDDPHDLHQKTEVWSPVDGCIDIRRGPGPWIETDEEKARALSKNCEIWVTPGFKGPGGEIRER
ncbi:galactonate dehydratase [Colletotrichum tabaci]|uniref:Galactonate dehydratase n=1 Tax=Colletotrichum tabaci TaxID=1209068 RepID=A0AAV9SY69_9PEZI